MTAPITDERVLKRNRLRYQRLDPEAKRRLCESIHKKAQEWRRANPDLARAKDHQKFLNNRWRFRDRDRVRYLLGLPNYRGTIEPYACLDIYCRDDWDCRLCGKPVDPMASGRMGHGASVCHVIPPSENGPDSPDNVVLAHKACNARPGRRVLEAVT